MSASGGRDTLGFLTESTLLPRAPKPINATESGMAGLRAAVASAASSSISASSSYSSSSSSSSSTSSAMSAIMERLKKNKQQQQQQQVPYMPAPKSKVNRGVSSRAAADELAREDDAAKLSKSTSNLEDKARLYAVLSGGATPHEVLDFARHLLSLPSSASFPPSVRLQVKKAAEEAAAGLGIDVRRELASIATISGAKRARDERQVDGDEDEDNDDDSAPAAAAAESLTVDFEYKRRVQAAASHGKKPKTEEPQAEVTAEKPLPYAPPAPLAESGGKPSVTSAGFGTSSSAPSLAILAGYEAAKQRAAAAGEEQAAKPRKSRWDNA